MDFACHTWTFNDLTLPEALSMVARLGFRCVDIGTGSGWNAARAAQQPRRAAADINADLELFNLTISDLYLMLPRITFADDRRDKDLELFRGLLPFAAALNISGLTVSPGLAQPDDADAAFDRSATALREMAAAAAEAGLAISIEPHMDSIAPTPEAALKLLDAVPNLKITLDWAELTCQNVPYEAILTLLPHARHIQIRQAARGQLQTTFERGRIDLPRMIKDVTAAGYGGVICVEVLNMPGRHGAQKINPLTESARLRDALRDARDSLQ